MPELPSHQSENIETAHSSIEDTPGSSRLEKIEGASPKEITEYVQDTFKKTFDSLVDSEFKHGAMLAVALGWVVTAEQAQKLFKESWEACAVFTVVALTYTIMHAIWTFQYYYRSRSAYEQLVNARYLPLQCFDFQRISSPMAIAFCIMNAIGTTMICVLIWHMFLT